MTGYANESIGGPHRHAVMRIKVSVKIVLGSAEMPLAQLMELTRGAIIPLDRKVGELVDIVINEHLIARGEVVVLDQEAGRFGISVTELASPSAA